MMMSKPIGIIGLGYVGLPLSLHFADASVPVLGFDVDPQKVEQLSRGESYILHIPSERVAAANDRKTFGATTDFDKLKECEAIIICVPTPLNAAGEPDISYILKTGREIGTRLQSGQLVVLESTTYPGTTDTELREVLEKTSGLKAGVDFHLAYSPEREDPGNPKSNLPEIPKVIGGYTPACLDKAKALYGRVIKTLVPVSSCNTAEAVKLMENIFRAVNIATVNELKMVYAAMGIDIWEVISAAKTKPFGFMPFYPGPGWGGHCVPIDPFYLTWKARQFGMETEFIKLAGQINTAMPRYVIRRIEDALQSTQKALSSSRILLLGIAYKANVDDDRESPAYVIWNQLEQAKAAVDYHDPHIPVIRPSREHSQFAGRKSVEICSEKIREYDVVVIVTAHAAVDYAIIAAEAALVVDTRNAMAALMANSRRLFKA
jgi:UDP-N-acetyl-D-glucosamine dehydrogenase